MGLKFNTLQVTFRGKVMPRSKIEYNYSYSMDDVDHNIAIIRSFKSDMLRVEYDGKKIHELKIDKAKLCDGVQFEHADILFEFKLFGQKS